jgi:ribulose-phosphate 3-epimerase
MVTNPEFYADEFKNLNIHNFTFHWETVVHHDRFISYLKTMFPSVGISFNPSTSLNIVPSYIWKLIDLVLIMSVNPGFGGQSFIESSIEKVEYLAHLKKQKNLHFQIQVDGGVNLQNAHKLKLAGANNLVAGSYIFSQGDSNLNHQDRLIAQLNSLK